MAKAHSRRNFLAKIKINGTWILEENEIKDGVFQAFWNLLPESGNWRPNINRLSFDVLGG